MKTTSLAIFSEEEHTLNKNLDALFREWSDFLLSIGFWEKYDIDYFVTDGIFPGYLAQRFKILFIGKESLDIAGQSYIDILYNAIHEKQIGGTFVNRSSFFPAHVESRLRHQPRPAGMGQHTGCRPACRDIRE